MNSLKPHNTLLNIRTAALLALSISLLMNLLFLIMFMYGSRPSFIRDEGPRGRFGRPPFGVESPVPDKRPDFDKPPHEFSFDDEPPARIEAQMRHVFNLNMTLVRFFNNFAMAFLLYLLNFRIFRMQWFGSKRGKIWYVAIIIAATAALSVTCSLIQIPFETIFRNIRGVIFSSLMRDFTLSVVVTLSSLLMYIASKQQVMAVENERLQAEYMKTRFIALKNQVDPHFLFNSLNTLASLIRTDASKATQYLEQLSLVFRYTLQNKEIITLKEELAFTLAYSNLMQIRYGDNLKVIDNVDEKYYDYSIIPISLQTLVENAIKHNVVSNRLPLTISITTDENAHIRVSNPIQPKKEPESGDNIGLSNLAERYRLLWDRTITITNTGTVFEVELPLINE
ncbi:MAG: histidine kinase [Tannerella sp.]|jgi:sensor histidine kinase YesM|nr:histidine kinase [Tannerella sp.]